MRRWAEIVGAAYVRPGAGPDAVDGVVPAAVVRPGSVEEVAAVVRAAEGRALVASGLGGHLDMGGSPRRFDALVRVDRLDRIVAHEAADMTVVVEAGCPLPRLAAALATAGQWLPLDPPRPDATTVGGLVAANLWGPLRTSQGAVRDHLIGLRVVSATGALVTGGGRVVKNVAGYDLPKLHVGAFGTLGVIVEAVFKVRPRPAGEVAVVIPCASGRAATDLGLAVRDCIEPLWLVADDAGALVVGLGGLAEEIAEASARVVALAPVSPRVVGDGAALRRRLNDQALDAAAVLRLAVLPADVGALLDAAAEAHVRALGHVGVGVVQVLVEDAAAVAPLVAALRARAVGAGGTLVVERAAAAAKRGVDVWGDVGAGLPLMRRLKATFDPEGRFAPGRFVGGL